MSRRDRRGRYLAAAMVVLGLLGWLGAGAAVAQTGPGPGYPSPEPGNETFPPNTSSSAPVPASSVQSQTAERPPSSPPPEEPRTLVGGVRLERELDRGSRGTLPITGGDILGLVAIGIGALGVGVVLRVGPGSRKRALRRS